MFISTNRQKYVLDKCIEAIKSTHSYSLDTHVYSKVFKLKYLIDPKANREYTLEINLSQYDSTKPAKFESVTLNRENGKVTVEIKGHESKFEEISKLMYDI